MNVIVVETELGVKTKGELDIVNITGEIEKIVSKTGIKNGIANVFVPGSTGAVTTIEYEPGLLKDLPNALERLAPRHAVYEHEKAWHDGNGHSHVRASIIGPSITIPIRDGALRLGTWQQVVFVELEVRPRTRRLVVTCLGE
jgi:secondary thiamine-phosphate synthase enzyme